jgi:DNA-binding GntR family transcriptional regulator
MHRKISLTERAYQQLRDDLLTCRLAPGDRINIKEIADRLGFSLGAVREALSRLTSEGFVTIEDRRGFRATPISIADMSDLIAVRTEIEGQCLRRAIAHGGLDWESAIVSAAHRLSRTPVYADGPDKRLNDAYAAAHSAFHETLVCACDSPWLRQMRNWLYAQSERYRYLTVPLARTERNVNHEHTQLAEAVLSRDADRAVALLSEHLSATAKVLIEREEASADTAPVPQQAGLRALAGIRST